MSLSINVLGSTSAGNCTILANGSEALMIDCGFSARYVTTNLEFLALTFNQLCGVFITHLHSDHISSSMLKRLFRENVPLFCHQDIREIIIERNRHYRMSILDNLLIPFYNDSLRIQSFTIIPFAVPHDSTGGCFGFTIYSSTATGIKKITIATDLAYPTDDLMDYFYDSDVIMIESNHDTEMLKVSPRPYWLKKRIHETGHLSNEQCADFLERVLKKSKKVPQKIILAHISQECNTNSCATACIQTMLQRNRYNGIEVVETYKRKLQTVYCL